MINKLIQMMIAMVIGLALLPVVNSFVTGLVTSPDGGTTDPTITDPTLVGLIELLPVLYVIVLVAGSIAYVSLGKLKD